MSFFYSHFKGATIDTQLLNDEVYPGDTLNGEIYIKGDDNEKVLVSGIYMYLWTEVNVKGEMKKMILQEQRLTEPFEILPKEEKTKVFKFPVPINCPFSTSFQHVYLSAGLDIKNVGDPTDDDFVRILPEPISCRLLDKLIQIGFTENENSGEIVEVLPNDSAFSNFKLDIPYVQKFSFVALKGDYANKFDECEIYFDIHPSHVNVLFKLDTKPVDEKSILNEQLNRDKKDYKFTIQVDDSTHFENQLVTYLTDILK